MERRSTQRRAGLIVGAVLVTAVAMGQAAAAEDAGDADPDEAVTIDFLQPLPKSMAFYPLFVGDELGYFAEEGVEVNLLPSGDIPATVIVPTGQADIGATTPTNIVQAAAAGEDFALVYEYYQRNVVSMVVPADSEVETVADLEGLTVGVTSEGAGDATLARAALQEVGLTPGEDVEIVVAGDGGPAVAEALQGGRLDAFAGAINDIVALQVAGIELREITPESFAAYPASSMIVRTETLAEESDEITRFLRAWSKATYAGMLDPDLVFAIAQDEVPEETADEEFGRVFLDLAIELQTPVEGIEAFGAVRPEAWTTVQEAMVEGGELEEVFDPASFLDDTLLADVNDWDRAEVESEVEAWVAENL